MKYIQHILFLTTILILSSCGGNGNKQNKGTDANNKMDNILDFAVAEKYKTLDPLKVQETVSYYPVSQIFEGLVGFDENDLTFQPALAEDWKVSKDGLVYTFNLRQNVHFQDNDCFKDGKGKELTSEDVVYTFKRICSDVPENYLYNLFGSLILGANKFHHNYPESLMSKDLEGVKAIDKYTVQITLTKIYSNFLELLPMAGIVAKEAIDKNAIVGTGPFEYLKENDTQKYILLVKNPNYHLSDKTGNKLPYLDGVRYNYYHSAQDRLKDFMDDKLDVITGLPPESIKSIVESQIADFQDKPVKYVLGRYPEMKTYYLSFNTTKTPLDNIKVRQAIAMAIDKNKIVKKVLKDEAEGIGNHGIVPPAISNYDFSSVVGLEFNVEKAKQLLKEAGFEKGKNFPVLKLISNNENLNVRVALNIQKQLLTNLNINVELESMSLKDALDRENKGESDISLSAWLGDYPDPTTFLVLAYGANVPSDNHSLSYINRSRYKNSKFDMLYEKAIQTMDEKSKLETCLEADQIIANEVPLVPLWYAETYKLLQSSVINYKPNPLDIQNLREVKIVPVDTENKKKDK